MYGSGVKTGMVITAANPRQLQQVHGVGLSACTVVVAGTFMPVAVVCLAVAITLLTSAAATLASVWSSPSLEHTNEWILIV